MTKEVAEKIVKGITDKIKCNTVDIDDWAKFWGFTREEYEEFLDVAVKAHEQQSCEKCEQPDENDELLSPDERADVLNAINDMLEEKGFDLEVGGYEDTNGVLFDVMLMKR